MLEATRREESASLMLHNTMQRAWCETFILQNKTITYTRCTEGLVIKMFLLGYMLRRSNVNNMFPLKKAHLNNCRSIMDAGVEVSHRMVSSIVKLLRWARSSSTAKSYQMDHWQHPVNNRAPGGWAICTLTDWLFLNRHIIGDKDLPMKCHLPEHLW